jgi:hypothetical protein
MKCGQSAAFESAFKIAGMRYAALLRDPTFRKMGPEAISARRDYKLAKEAVESTGKGTKNREIVSGNRAL